MRFQILGPLEVYEGTTPVEVSAPKQRALLILLLIEAGRVVTPDVILDRLWPDRPPTAGLKTVRFHVSKLRSALEPEVKGGGFEVVETHDAGYTVDAGRHEIDSRIFERLAGEARRELDARPDRAQRLLSEALGLWRGAALLDVAYEEFAADEARRLDALRLAATEDRIHAELRLGRSEDLVPELETMVTDYPLRERPAELLMQALYAAGRSADAIAAGQALRRRLGEIGLDPPPSLTLLEEQILSHDTDLTPRTRPDAAGPRPAHLPRRLSSFIGRKSEIEEIRSVAEGARLVTLVGPPGSGKTRLGIEVAVGIGIDTDAEPVWVELTEVADPALTPQAVVTALGVRPPLGVDAMQLVIANLRDRAGLVVLDNCEHVLVVTARLVMTVLEACPEIRILATSREVLGVPGEQVWPVPPFTLPPVAPMPIAELLEIDSVQLFVDRAREANPRFTVTEDNKDDIAAICRRLDGLPLAIELAASATEALSANQIVNRLAPRFADVPAVRRLGSTRQATMEAAVRWSYELLDPIDKTVFARLSAFAGGFTMAAAEEVAGWGEVERSDVFNSILRLVHKSLLVPTHRRGGQVRYRMLTVLRQFGQRELRAAGHDREADLRHAGFFADLAERIAPYLEGPKAALGRDVADEELDNLRSAIEASINAGDTHTALRIAAALTWYWYWRSYIAEGYRWNTRILAAADEESPEQAQVIYALGIFETIMGRFLEGSAAFERARAAARELNIEILEAAALTGLGVNARDQGSLAAALEYLRAAEEINRRIGATARLALTLRFVGLVEFMLGHLAPARAALDECFVLFEGLGHKGGMGWALEGRALVGFRMDENPRYEDAARAASLYSEVNDRRNQAWLLLHTAGARRRSGELAEAGAATEQALEIFVELGDRRGTAHAVLESGIPHVEEGDEAAAGPPIRRSLALFDDIGDSGGAAAAHGYLGALAVLAGDASQAHAHCSAWLGQPAEDRNVWSMLDVLEALDGAVAAAEPDPDIRATLARYRQAIAGTGSSSAASVDLSTLPEAVASAVRSQQAAAAS